MIADMHSTSGDRPDEPAESLMELSKLVTAVVAHSLTVVDPAVTVQQLRVLVMVGSRGPVNVSAVAGALGVNPSGASRACDRLVSAGLLHRREAEGDRRNVALTVTRSGQELIDSLLGHRRMFFEAVVSEMGEADRKRLTRALGEFSDAVRRVGANGRLSVDEARLLEWLV
jgi:DNA-binding MarR family transcriptional regulator